MFFRWVRGLLISRRDKTVARQFEQETTRLRKAVDNAKIEEVIVKQKRVTMNQMFDEALNVVERKTQK